MRVSGWWIAGAAVIGILAVVILTRRPTPGVAYGGQAAPGAPYLAPVQTGNKTADNVAAWTSVGLGALSGFANVLR